MMLVKYCDTLYHNKEVPVHNLFYNFFIMNSYEFIKCFYCIFCWSHDFLFCYVNVMNFPIGVFFSNIKLNLHF